MISAAFTKYGIGKTCTAFLLAAAVNVLIVILLAILNGAASLENRRPPDATPVLTLMKMTGPRESESPGPDTPPEPEIMTVDLDLSTPQPIVLEPIEVDLSVADMSEHTVPVVAVLPAPRAAPNGGDPDDSPHRASPHSASRVDEPPRELANIPPQYPQAALRRGIEGEVMVRLLIDERGKVEDVQVLRVEGHSSFREAVLDVVHKWTFRPARHGGRPVKSLGHQAHSVRTGGVIIVRNTICIAAALSCLFAICSPAWAQEDTRDMRRARSLYEEKKYREAASILEEVCREQPTYADAHRLLGHTYYQLGRTDDARKALAQAVAHGRLTPDVLARLAQIERRQNRTAALLAGLRLRMLVKPQDRAWCLLYADVLASAGGEDEAEEIYKAIIEAAPAQPDTFVRLGNLCLREGRHIEAISAFETACHLGESSPRLPETIAELWFNAGDKRRALLWYERAIKLQDKPAERVRLRRAELLFWTEEFDKAEAAARLLANSENRGSAGKAYLLLGQIAMQRNRPEIAVAHWEEAVQAGMDEPQILAFLGSHYFNNGQYKKAADCLEKRLASGGLDKALLRYLIISLIRSGEDERARDEMQTYLEHYGLDDQAERLVLSFVRDTGNGGK